MGHIFHQKWLGIDYNYFLKDCYSTRASILWQDQQSY